MHVLCYVLCAPCAVREFLSFFQWHKFSWKSKTARITKLSCFRVVSLMTFSCYTKIQHVAYLTLNDWSWEEQWIFPWESQCFLWRSRGKHWDQEKRKIHCSPRDQSVIICYIAKQNKCKFWKTQWDSSNNIRPPLILCNSGQHFAGNIELFPD